MVVLGFFIWNMLREPPEPSVGEVHKRCGYTVLWPEQAKNWDSYRRGVSSLSDVTRVDNMLTSYNVLVVVCLRRELPEYWQ